jgi:putative aminopeptidase FrvX
MLDNTAIRFLRNYINNSSPTGYEMNGQELWLKYLRPYVDDYFQDNYYNTVGVINPNAPFKIMLEAHADEISWLVNFIDEKGFIYVLKNGGADEHVTPGRHVKIHTSEGVISGVFGWPAIHIRYDIPEIRVDAQHLFVDCGCKSGKEVEDLGVRVGDIITFTDEFQILNRDYFVGRALDNRIGGLIIAQVARIIKEKGIHLPFGLYIVNAVQEEVGFNGAKMISHTIKPDIAIVTDVTHDTNTPFIDMRKHGDTACGRGPVLAIAPAIHKGLLQLIKEAAFDAGIPYQLVAISRETGTDTHVIALANGGTYSVLISPPLRYMHTPVEIVHRKDVEYVIQLMIETLLRIDPQNLNLQRRTRYYD